MKTEPFSQMAEDYRRIERAIKFIATNFQTRPSLDDIASAACLSKYHFDRLFRRWAGISPIRFLQFLTLEYAKEQLVRSRSVLDAAYDSGLSGPGRLHDLFVTFEAITPGEFKQGGEGLDITYGFHPTPFGECLIATTAKGICHLGFIDNGNNASALRQLKQAWPQAHFAEDTSGTGSIIKAVFSHEKTSPSQPFHLLLKGTNFQINVWKALLTIPDGKIVSYGDVANLMGKPSASRAVGKAVAANPVAFLIPCHRVITNSGKIHRYRWGTARKKAIIGWEAAQLESVNP